MLVIAAQAALLITACICGIAAVLAPSTEHGRGNARWGIAAGAVGLLAMALLLPDRARHGQFLSTLVWSVFFCGLAFSRWLAASRTARP